MQNFDFLVVGGGIAGLSAAVRLADFGTVLCVTKEELAESNTSYAQGGIAVAMGGERDIALHLDDTLAAGDGLVDRAAAELLVGEGPGRVGELITLGAEFDRGASGELERTREGAHSLSRILHAHGDATGREIARALLQHVRTLGSVTLLEWTTSVDLILSGERVVGATLLGEDGNLSSVYASAVLIASGGAGQVYSDTTNPAVATGDGIAMAYRAGAALEDMEFYQFHPTAFAVSGAPRFLLSEALRGEGALLVNSKGERFMQSISPLAELAPRDVVARAITREDQAGPVYLDMRGVHGLDPGTRFPGISKFLASYGFDLARDLVPVRPAAHYLMGGIKTDVHGRTSLPGLYAAGEAACTGVHGANRLASNSLLEGLVFGVEAAETMASERVPLPLGATGKSELAPPSTKPVGAAGDAQGTEMWIADLRRLMWQDAGLLRDAAGLDHARGALEKMEQAMPCGMTRRAVEARNLFTVATVIVASAAAREESRGAHFRNDFPHKWGRAQHSVITAGHLRFEP